ncbi:hypothetical protein [Planotetraspora kaengkrachanensis]|uniref:Uncharacterized protein n=1 Tax=Planotetraspora kaengkrachanensis TaxID=575193 RepID=A0A8J3PQV2_9ACTN|nr:hypothetical protein [Planotetraspora kaengkrachanensis]GIG79156.1 hypothetical protein Pka01_22830 [Planotetraspora kaengkrachanensis]
MTFPDDDFEELLRASMRAEADSVVPSPEGLNIIRGRIEKRGLRGTFWWRAGVSVAGAVLVAGTVVMLVPDLRTQVSQSTGISVAGADGTELPDTSSTGRPPAGTIPTPVITPSATPHSQLSPTPSHKPSTSVRPTPPKTSPCATRGAGQTPAPPSCPPEQQTPTPPVTTPATVSPTPTPSDTPTPTPTPTPTETATTNSAVDDTAPAS